ncbi:MAG: hypothetical protein HYV02_03570 [Deltaproteobacteria bacterium]|nr:hypothetical protein [Deltaproteobacteria bacterium]
MNWKRWRGIFACALCMLAGCGTASDKALDDVLSALDAGNYAEAVTLASAALADDATNFQLMMALSSAYSGRAGVELLDLAETLSDTDNESEAFKQIHSALVATISATGLPDLRLAITTLTDFTGTVADATNYRFQLGMLQAIEAFALPTMTAKPISTSTVTATDITATHRADVQSDFLDADNNLILGNLGTDNQLVEVVRKNYCVLKDRSTDTGFSLAELQDITTCQLSDSPSSVSTFQSASVTSCADFNFDNCTAVDTTL